MGYFDAALLQYGAIACKLQPMCTLGRIQELYYV
jgi:hypothetical protein